MSNLQTSLDTGMDMVMKMLGMNTNIYTFPFIFTSTSEKQSTFNVFLLAIPNYSTYSTMPGPTAANYLCAKCETAYDY